MEDTENENLELLTKLSKEVKKLKTGRIPIWITITIMFIVMITEIVFKYGDYLNKSIEIELVKMKQESEIQFKLMEFYLDNYDKLLSEDSTERKNIFTILVALNDTIQNVYTGSFIDKLKQVADSHVGKTINKIRSKIKPPMLVFDVVGLITENDGEGVKNASVKLTGHGIDTTLMTDNRGYFSMEIEHHESIIKFNMTVLVDGVQKNDEPIEFEMNKTLRIQINN